MRESRLLETLLVHGVNRYSQRCRLVGSWLALALCATLAPFAARAADDSNTGTLSFVLENDLFYNTDRNYTNGVQLSWVPPAGSTPAWAVRMAHALPWFPQDGSVGHAYVLGQSMFTAQSTQARNPPADERPYAGWLYGAIVLGVETGQQLDRVALTVGVVGPASFAEKTQRFIHDLRHKDQPQGWDTQLRNEPGVVVTRQRSWRGLARHSLAGLELDVTPHLGAAVGNVFTYADAGLTLRYGRHLPVDYGPPRIQPGVPGSGMYVPRNHLSWYLFAGGEGRAVARNIFLDGNTFRDSRSVDKKPFVGDFQFGIAVAWRSVRLSYTHVLRSREFETQRDSDEFGAVSISVAF